MNDRNLPRLEALVDRAVAAVRARPGRRRLMREELLAHLVGDYEQELERCADPAEAADAAVRRFGDLDELGRQLGSSVPTLERLCFTLIGTKETPMRRYLWIVIGIVAVLVGPALILPALAKYNEIGSLPGESGFFLALGVVILLTGFGMIGYSVGARRAQA